MRGAEAAIKPIREALRRKEAEALALEEDRTKGGSRAQISPHWIAVDLMDDFRAFCNARGRQQRDVLESALREYLTRARVEAEP